MNLKPAKFSPCLHARRLHFGPSGVKQTNIAELLNRHASLHHKSVIKAPSWASIFWRFKTQAGVVVQ
jgi:hypothetical protein